CFHTFILPLKARKILQVMVGRESGIRYAEQTAKQKGRPANTLISLTPLCENATNLYKYFPKSL
ncbi:hypothetical protein, partial [Anaerotruncus colihominis]|uniref:hypothetical protein n=1 Tax=Anaerotruncus colihominis TaxID=169435 RepID=UPI002430B230